jgi:hypothetical protein
MKRLATAAKPGSESVLWKATRMGTARSVGTVNDRVNRERPAGLIG